MTKDHKMAFNSQRDKRQIFLKKIYFYNIQLSIYFRIDYNYSQLFFHSANMYTSLQEKENFQQICFLNSKLVFFFGSDQKQTMKNAHQDNKKCSMRKSTQIPLLERNRSEKNKNKSIQSVNSKKPLTSVNKKRFKEEKPSKSFQFDCNNQIRLSKMQTDKNYKLEVRAVQKQNSQRKTQVITNKQSFYQLKHHEIRYFFGTHHKLYKKHIDYLIKPALLPPFRDIQVSNKSMNGQQEHIPNLQFNSSKTQNLMIPTFHSTYRKSYAFENERAPIAEGIMNKNLYQIYNKVIKQNYQTQKFVDRQFCHYNFPQINGKKVYWIYKTPDPSLFIFPVDKKMCKQKIQRSIQRIPFVCFMELLYEISPQFFTRLFEPPINNVFSVWLFFNNLFQPVIIDGYFPVDKNQKYIFGDADNLWITIFSKCVCKIFQTYNLETLKKIDDFEIYNILTGKKLIEIPITYFDNQDEKIMSFFRKQKNKNRTIVCRNSQSFFIVTENQCKKLIKDIKQKGERHMKSLCFYLISKPEQTYVASFSVFNEMITKFQVLISGLCELRFLLPNQKMKGYSKIYIYENQGNEQLNKLKLIHQINPSEQKSVKVKAGSYKIFYEDGKKLMKNIFSHEKDRQYFRNNGTYAVTLMGTCPIKLSQGQLLQKYNGTIEDSKSFYRSG